MTDKCGPVADCSMEPELSGNVGLQVVFSLPIGNPISYTGNYLKLSLDLDESMGQRSRDNLF